MSTMSIMMLLDTTLALLGPTGGEKSDKQQRYISTFKLCIDIKRLSAKDINNAICY
jgi:hypothetical protein